VSAAPATDLPLAAISRVGVARRVTLAQSVTERIIALIEDGHIRPGETLPTEPELMARLGVGRSSVREAMRGLQLVGLVETRPRIGTVVVSAVGNGLRDQMHSAIAHAALREVFAVRALLEGEAAALAAAEATPRHIVEIERRAAALEIRVAAGRSYFRENVAFHLAIAEASRNSVLRNTLAGMIDALRDLREDLTDRVSRRGVPPLAQRDIAEHRAILAAIAAHDEAKARRAMQTHLAGSFERFGPSGEITP